MASAAAVAANEARSPLGNDLGEDDGYPGEITSGIYAKDEELPGVNGDSDEDEDLPSNPLRSKRRPQDDAADDEDEEDLFGDEEDEEGEQQQRVRQLDDEELDSGDDADRMDRIRDDEEQEQEMETQEQITMDLELPRQAIPEPSDGEMYLLKVPNFMAIEPHAWDHTAFQPPTTDHHSKQAPSATFSAYNTALTTIRWRKSPSHPSQLQSNARINRWSNGSLTLQLASDPTVQYEIEANALVPPQRNPIKPTPTSIQTTNQKGGRHGVDVTEKYDQRQDAFTYLLRPHEESSTLIVTNKITAGLLVKQSATVEDDAIERLQASLAAASNASKVNGASGINLVQIDEDPEKAKEQALQAAREKERRDRKHQAAIDREAAKSSSRLHARGARHSGLNVGMLEDDELGGEGLDHRGRPTPNKARAKQRRRRNSEYSEDEDFGRKRFSREDEYDEDDGFLAPSDEEEVVEDDDDPDDGIVDTDFDDEKRNRERTPKRDREVETGDEDGEADAPGEEDEEVQHSRTKRRRIVDDEEEDEE